ncbi:hypothetical protein [Streptomyces sp. NPDC059063]|uniref:hypothetical protein n=1 Tax=unclassified Streptomyces TaxID=2593676 RepID=UPI0036D0F857
MDRRERREYERAVADGIRRYDRDRERRQRKSERKRERDRLSRSSGQGNWLDGAFVGCGCLLVWGPLGVVVWFLAKWLVF